MIFEKPEVFTYDFPELGSDDAKNLASYIKYFDDSKPNYRMKAYYRWLIGEDNLPLKYLDFECDNDHTALCRRRPVDHANLESWTFEEATESGFPCWIKEWVDSVGIQEGSRCEEGLHVKIPVQIYYDEGPVIGGM